MLTCRQIAELLGLSKHSVVHSLNVLILRKEAERIYLGPPNRYVYEWKKGDSNEDSTLR